MLKPSSPLPWNQNGRYVGNTTYPELAECWNVPGATADAAYIVAACNAYPKLVEALNSAIDTIRTLHGDVACEIFRQRLNAALAAAGETQ